MSIKITTKSGSVYTIERGICRKSKAGHILDVFMVWSMMQLIDPIDEETLDFPWNKPELWESVSVPRVGSHMCIQGKDVWWITTEIVKVENDD